MKKKSLALLLAIAIVVVGVVAGTVAWLTDKTPSVTNTFTTSDINIELKETKNHFQMIPGEGPEGYRQDWQRGVLSVCEAGEVCEFRSVHDL